MMKPLTFLLMTATASLALSACKAAPEASASLPPLPFKPLPADVQRGSVLWDEFATDPMQRDWKQSALPWQKFAGRWVGENGGHYVSVSEGFWESPLVPVRAFGYYRFRVKSRMASNGHWAARFYDAKGEELVADNYDNLFASTDWGEQEFVFRAHALATGVKLRLQSDKSPVDVARVSLHPTDDAGALAWTKRVLSEVPAVRYAPPTPRGRHLPRTAARLRNGGTLRIVMLGDSICNDTSNSNYEAQLHRIYPRTRFEVITSVRGGTLSTWYQQENRVEEYVLRFKPDLLVIAGISHGYDVEAIRSVIHQVRAHSNTDFLLLSDVITPQTRVEGDYLKFSGLPPEVAKENVRLFPQRLRELAQREGVELLDMRAAWSDYLRTSPPPVEWFQRDEIHANARGKQVVGTILARYLAFIPA